MPDALELPGMLCAVVPLMGGEGRAGRVVDEFVALALGHPAGSRGFARRRSRLMPGFAAVVGTLNDLAEPSAGLGGVNAIGIGGGSLEVIQLPSGKQRSIDFPLVALAV